MMSTKKRAIHHPSQNLRISETQQLVITIDGPAGVGKSTVAKQLARALGLIYLDTGATYRSVAYLAIQKGVPVTDEPRVAALARQLRIRLTMGTKGLLRVFLHGKEVTQAIRTAEVTEAAAVVSQFPAVRSAMVKHQRELARQHGVPRVRSGRHPERKRGSTSLTTIPSKRIRSTPLRVRPEPVEGRSASRDQTGGVVVEGRDTGSVVFPHATYKFFLDADPAVRATRRQRELFKLYGSHSPIEMIQQQIDYRDGLDRTRRVGPLITPTGAVTIDTTHRTASQVVRLILRRIRYANHPPSP